MARTRDETDSRLSDPLAARPGLATVVLAGAVGGLYGAVAMSVLRLGLHRAGLIDKMVPQAVEEGRAFPLRASPETPQHLWNLRRHYFC